MDKVFLNQKCIELVNTADFIIRYSQHNDFIVKFDPNKKPAIEKIFNDIEIVAWDFLTRKDSVTGRTFHMCTDTYLDTCAWFDVIFKKFGQIRPSADLSEIMVVATNNIQRENKKQVFKDMDAALQAAASSKKIVYEKTPYYMYQIQRADSR